MCYKKLLLVYIARVVGVIWIALFAVALIQRVGEPPEPSTILTWWDALRIFGLGILFPIWLGYVMHKEKDHS